MRGIGFAAMAAAVMIAAPAAAQENQREVSIYFDWDSATVPPSGEALIDAALAATPGAEQVSVELAGHTDRSVAATYAVGLSERMAESVKQSLIARGVPEGRITTTAYGSSRPAVPTAPGAREALNRRVEMRISW